jgi:hypothetical protein
MQNQAFAVQLLPRPIAWRKTPSTSWQCTHLNVLKLDTLGFWMLELDPVAEFDRSSIVVYKLVPSNGPFEFEPDWKDSISFPDWQKDMDWREIVSDLMGEIEPKVLEKLRQFSHFHWRLIESLSEWQGFKYLLDPNPALAACLAGRLRVGSQDGRRPRLDYKNLYYRTEAEIAAALGFGDSDEAVSILRKLPPDACTRYDLRGLADLIGNPVTRKALIEAEVISHPALLFHRNPYLSRHLTGRFLSDIAKMFPRSLEILTCPWGPLLRGGGKGEEFTWKYQQALEVVEYAEEPTIYSLDDLERKHSAIFIPTVLSYGGSIQPAG